MEQLDDRNRRERLESEVGSCWRQHVEWEHADGDRASANDDRGSGAARAASAERAVAESAGEWATAAGSGGEDATRSGDGRDVVGRADTSDDGAGGAA